MQLDTPYRDCYGSYFGSQPTWHACRNGGHPDRISYTHVSPKCTKSLLPGQHGSLQGVTGCFCGDLYQASLMLEIDIYPHTTARMLHELCRVLPGSV